MLFKRLLTPLLMFNINLVTATEVISLLPKLIAVIKADPSAKRMVVAIIQRIECADRNRCSKEQCDCKFLSYNLTEEENHYINNLLKFFES